MPGRSLNARRPGTRSVRVRELPISHQDYARRILGEFEARNGTSQRLLADRLGIALGLTNLLVRRMVRFGWVRVVRVKPNRLRYILTPKGMTEKARMTQAYFNSSVRFYAQTRDRIRERLAALSATWPGNGSGPAGAEPEKRVVFYCGGEVAEVGYLCLQGTDLQLVGVVDDAIGKFFDVPVHPEMSLSPDDLAGRPYDRIIVMSFDDCSQLRMQLRSLRIPEDRVFWL